MAEDTSGVNEINKIDEDKSKDQSDKKPIAAKKRVVAVPHYLRASTGSCHDACKYGKPHVFKEKPWRAVRRMSAPPPMTENTLKIQIFVENKLKKKSVALDKLSDSPSSEAPARPSLKSEKSAASQKSVGVDKLDHSPSNEAPASNTTMKKSFSSSTRFPKSEKTVVSRVFVDYKLKRSVGVDKLDDSPSNEAPATNTTMKKSFSSSTRSPKSEKTVVSRVFVDNKLKKSVDVDKLDDSPSSNALATGTTVKKSFSSSTRSPFCDSSKLVKQEARPLNDSSSKPPKVMKKAVLFPGRLSLTASSDFSKRDVSDSIKDLVSISAPSSPKVRRTISAGTVRPNRPAVRPPISSDAFKALKRQPGTAIKFSDSPRKVLTPSATTLSVKRSPQATTSLHSSRFTSVKSKSNTVRKTVSIGQKDRTMMNKAEVRKPNNEMVKEKTLHMIETETSEVSNHFIQSPSPLSPESLNSSSQGNSLSFTSNEVELESDSTDSDGDDSISNYNRSVNSKAVGVDQDSTGLKLKFRRGKVVELEPGIRGPRKLKFKQGTILGDDQVASSGSRRKSSLKKRVVDSEKKEVGTDSDQVKIALKHQETVMKKDEQGLYNNVIEETASKLVEKRKSKVMALVGAFETVISLQERKPSTAC